MMFGQGIQAISEKVSAAINDAALGRCEWSDVCSALTSTFPGSYAALFNQNFVRSGISFAVADGIEDKHLNSFLTHYSNVNPWQKVLAHAPNGAILVSQRDAPANRFRDSEFYNDWMRAVGDFDASVGFRLRGGDDDEIICLPVHYSERLSEAYDATLQAVMGNVQRSLVNAVQIATYIRGSSEQVAARSALTALSNTIAFVVDNRMKLVDANQKALDAFSNGSPTTCRQGIVRFVQASTATALANCLRNCPSDFTGKRLTMVGDEQWLISVNHLPPAILNGLIRSRPQFLIQVHKLAAQSDTVDGDLLVEAYGLTPSEVQLCGQLAAGLMLADAAKLNCISYENARQKLKSIFRKTGTGSQSDLKSLLRLLR